MKKAKKNWMKEASHNCGKLAGQPPLNLSDENIGAMRLEGAESLCRDVGLLIMERWLEAEVRRHCGNWGSQAAFRHGRQRGGEPARRYGGIVHAPAPGRARRGAAGQPIEHEHDRKCLRPL